MDYLTALNYASKLLKSVNNQNYRLDSELLLSRALNKSREEILINLNKEINLKKFKNFENLLTRRLKSEPIAYIFKKKEFWKNSFFVNKDVLIPRPETEIIVEEVLKLTHYNSSKNFLDVGTGSGCIILSILKERPKSYGTALDISKKALTIAAINAKMHHLRNKIKFINNDIDKFIDNKYDFIISNPPYINNFNLKRLEDDIRRFEPIVALKAGTDGLKIINKLISKSKKLLKNNGKFIFEIGDNQESFVKKILMKNKFYINKVCKDLQSISRVIISTKLI